MLWGTIPVSLWKYRNGDYQAAEQWCRRSLVSSDKISARDANIHIILAMACFKLDRHREAQAELQTGQELVENRFSNGQSQTNNIQGFWWDWEDATILLREAVVTMGEDDNLAPSEAIENSDSVQ
jgi:hypothetical protein